MLQFGNFQTQSRSRSWNQGHRGGPDFLYSLSRAPMVHMKTHTLTHAFTHSHTRVHTHTLSPSLSISLCIRQGIPPARSPPRTCLLASIFSHSDVLPYYWSEMTEGAFQGALRPGLVEVLPNDAICSIRKTPPWQTWLSQKMQNHNHEYIFFKSHL